MRSQVSAVSKILCFLLTLFGVACSLKKRSLVVPPTSPTRHQLISGIGVPLALKDEAITLGLVLKAQYYLPETANQLKFNFFPDIWGEYDKDFTSDTVQHPFPNGRRRREVKIDPLSGQKYESYEGEVEQIGDVPLSNLTTRDHIDEDDEFDDQFEEDLQDKKLMEEYFLQQPHVENEDEGDEVDFSSSRWDAYDALSSTLESKGFSGRICVMRAICEAADVPFSEHLMSELFHIFFTPSTTSEPISKARDYDYIKAELIGRDKAAPDCEKIFYQCKRSIMEIFTEVYDNKMFQFV